MSQQTDWQAEIDRHYGCGAPGDPRTPLRGLLLSHSRSVAELALELAHRNRLPLDDGDITAAAMLHDIGIIRTDAPGIHCHGTQHYLRHGTEGAAMLRADGMPEWLARVAERHTGTGITADDIRTNGLPMPEGDYMPETLLEKLVCYADKFYSKSGSTGRKSQARVRASLARFGAASSARFDALASMFGLPDPD